MIRRLSNKLMARFVKLTKPYNSSMIVKPYGSLKTVSQDYEKQIKSGKILILGTLSARSGTRWLCDIFSHHKTAIGSIERFNVAEAFYRYIKFNNLPIDCSGFIRLIKKGILQDWEKVDISLVFSPYFSHGILELYNELKPQRIIFAINDPEFTVTSIYNKEVFKETYYKDSPNLILGYQPELGERWSHFFGRIVPKGNFYSTWEKLTRIGKISWWGNRINMDIYQQLQEIPTEKIWIFKLKEADQNYDYYKKLAKEFNLQPLLEEEEFLTIKAKTVKKSNNVKREWTEREKDEFLQYTKQWTELYNML